MSTTPSAKSVCAAMAKLPSCAAFLPVDQRVKFAERYVEYMEREMELPVWLTNEIKAAVMTFAPGIVLARPQRRYR